MKKEVTKKKYAKPRILYREKAEVLAAVCDSSWGAAASCRIRGLPQCFKIRL